MFSRLLKNLVRGGAAGSENPGAGPRDVTGGSLAPGDRCIKRAKRKRQESGETASPARNSESVGHAGADAGDDREEGEPPAKKVKTQTEHVGPAEPSHDDQIEDPGERVGADAGGEREGEEPTARGAEAYVEHAVPPTPACDSNIAVEASPTPQLPSSRKRRQSFDDPENHELPAPGRHRTEDTNVNAPAAFADTEKQEDVGAGGDSLKLGANDTPFLPPDDERDPGVDVASPGANEHTPHNKQSAVARDLASGLWNIARQYRASANARAVFLPDLRDHKAPRRLRRQANKYLKRIRVDRNGDGALHEGEGEADEEHLIGIGSWPGSSTVPESLRREPADEDDSIELPRRKPHRTDWREPTANDKLCGAKKGKRPEARFVRRRAG